MLTPPHSVTCRKRVGLQSIPARSGERAVAPHAVLDGTVDGKPEIATQADQDDSHVDGELLYRGIDQP